MTALVHISSKFLLLSSESLQEQKQTLLHNQQWLIGLKYIMPDLELEKIHKQFVELGSNLSP
jgi:hypothetical protein